MNLPPRQVINSYTLLFFSVVFSRTPFISNGYGMDLDSWLVISSADQWQSTGEYIASRLPGFPVYEWMCRPFVGMPYFLPNFMSALLLATGMVFLAAALRRLKFHSPFLAAFAVAFVPVVYISSTVTMDYVAALCFAMIALYASMTDRPVAAGVFVGLAAGVRLTSGLFMIPFLLLLTDQVGAGSRLKGAFNFIFSFAVVLLCCYWPLFHTYGLEFLRIPQVEHQPLYGVIYKATIGVWGVTGCLALTVLTLKSVLLRNNAAGSDGLNRRAVIASWTVVLLFTALFIWRPMESGYLIPLVPFVILLTGSVMESQRFVRFTLLMALSSFVFSVSQSRNRPDDVESSSEAIDLSISGQEFTLDFLKGPITAYESRREGFMDYLQAVSDQLVIEEKPVALVCGEWYPYMNVMTRRYKLSGVELLKDFSVEEISRLDSAHYRVFRLSDPGSASDTLDMKVGGVSVPALSFLE